MTKSWIKMSRSTLQARKRLPSQMHSTSNSPYFGSLQRPSAGCHILTNVHAEQHHTSLWGEHHFLTSLPFILRHKFVGEMRNDWWGHSGRWDRTMLTQSSSCHLIRHSYPTPSGSFPVPLHSIPWSLHISHCHSLTFPSAFNVINTKSACGLITWSNCNGTLFNTMQTVYYQCTITEQNKWIHCNGF